MQAELQAELQLKNSASSVIYTNSRGHVKCLTCMWDDNQKELENLYAQTHQFSPRLFKNSALPWNNHKDSHICSPEQMTLRKSVFHFLPKFFLINHRIYISLNDLENLIDGKERVGLCWFCSVQLYTCSQSGLFLKKTKGKVMFTWVFSLWKCVSSSQY